MFETGIKKQVKPFLNVTNFTPHRLHLRIRNDNIQ